MAPPVQQVASVTRGGKLVEKQMNRGNTGHQAGIATDKDHNLFSTGEDPLAATFGTEKQTASDPFDLRALRRMVTTPLSVFEDEDRPVEMPGEEDIDRVE